MDVNSRQTVECTLFASAFETKTPVAATLGGYLDEVKNGKHKPQVDLLRAYLSAGESEKATATKKKLPLLVAGGVMAGGRKLEHMVRYSGCVVGDLDHVPGSPAQLLCRARELPYVKAGHISPSGTGLKLFVLVDSDLEHHAQAFMLVSRMLEVDLPGVQVDPSGKDPNRGCFAGYDPDAFYKEVAEVVQVPVCNEPLPASNAGGNTLANYIGKFEQDNPFTDGGRHSYLVRLVSALNSAGFSESEVTAECLYRYTAPGFGEKEILGTVADIYRRYRLSHGSNLRQSSAEAQPGVSLKSRKNPTPIPAGETAGNGSSLGFDIEADEASLPSFGEEVWEHLPPLLLDTLKVAVSDRERDLIALASVTALGSTLPNVEGMLKKDEYQLPFYTLILGPSGSGKGCVDVVRYLIGPWQVYVLNNSQAGHKEYLAQLEAFELYKARQKASAGKAPQPGTPPEEPVPVPLRRLHISGYTTTARMIEQLEENKPYASFLYETELESSSNTVSQDFGNYSYVLNQAFQHERISCSSKMNGSAYVDHPVLGFLATGTPGMLPRFIPSTESGLFSRMLIYRLTGYAEYQPLTSSDDTKSVLHYLRGLGQRVLDMAIHLEKHETFVRFSDAQRKRLDRYFEKEYNNVRVFGNDDVASVVLRYRLIIFRIAMTLTAIRKGEALGVEDDMVVSDEDFGVAFRIGTVCLKHSLFVATSLRAAAKTQPHKVPTAQLDLFADLPDEFTAAQIQEAASVRGISRSAVFRMLKRAQDMGFVISYSRGCYKKTESGKHVRNSGMG